jgi:hypothetical protein
LLESLLKSTGHFVGQGEVLGHKGRNVLAPVAYLRGQSLRWPDKNYLCHVKPCHLTNWRRWPVDPRAFLQALDADGWRIIYLHRDDRVRHILSLIVADARGAYHKQDDNPEVATIHVDRARFVAGMQRRDIEMQEFEALREINHHTVRYERDLQDAATHQQTIDGVLDFLSLPRRPASTMLRKVTARPLRDIVSNYDEFAEWITELGLGASLEEPEERLSNVATV